MSRIVLEKIEHKKDKNDKDFIRAEAKPGGWVSIWDPAFIALVREHGSGPYEAETVKKGEFTNIIELAYAPSTEPAKGEHTPGPYRDPIQIIRTDGVRFALDTWRLVLELNGPQLKPARLYSASDLLSDICEGAEAYTRYLADGTRLPLPVAQAQSPPHPAPMPSGGRLSQTSNALATPSVAPAQRAPQPSQAPAQKPLAPSDTERLEDATPIVRLKQLRESVGWTPAQVTEWLRAQKWEDMPVMTKAEDWGHLTLHQQSLICDRLEAWLRDLELLPEEQPEQPVPPLN